MNEPSPEAALAHPDAQIVVHDGGDVEIIAGNHAFRVTAARFESAARRSVHASQARDARSAPPAIPGALPARLGSYTFVRRLGTGAFGDVWLAIHADSGAERALKVLHDASARDLASLRAEARNAWSLSIPGVVVPLALEEAGGRVVLVMEVVKGRPLLAHLDAIASPEERRRRIDELVDTIARTIAAMHAQGVVHGDIKSTNVLVAPDGSPTISRPIGPPRHACSVRPADRGPG